MAYAKPSWKGTKRTTTTTRTISSKPTTGRKTGTAWKGKTTTVKKKK